MNNPADKFFQNQANTLFDKLLTDKINVDTDNGQDGTQDGT